MNAVMVRGEAIEVCIQMTTLTENIEFYQTNRSTIHDDAAGRRVVVVADCKVVGYYINKFEALKVAHSLGIGTLVRDFEDESPALIASNFATKA